MSAYGYQPEEIEFQGKIHYHTALCDVFVINNKINNQNDKTILVIPPEESNVCVLRQPLPIEGVRDNLTYTIRFLKPLGMSSPMTKHTLVFSNQAELEKFIAATN